MKFLDDLWDNAVLTYAAYSDAVGNLNPLDDRFMSGTAPATAATAEIQNAEREGREADAGRAVRSSEGGLRRIGEATTATVGDVVDKASNAVDVGLGWLPWVAGAVVVVGGLILLAPYVTATKEIAKAVS